MFIYAVYMLLIIIAAQVQKALLFTKRIVLVMANVF